jgi:choline dehydrogenase-like flavoprotein
MLYDFDVLIIGSGAGGGTVAAELAPLCADGARIIVLESGLASVTWAVHLRAGSEAPIAYSSPPLKRLA